MKQPAWRLAVGLVACALSFTFSPASAKLTHVKVEDKELTFHWYFNWDGVLAPSVLAPPPGSTPYWKGSAAIVATPPFPASFDDLTVTLTHFALGPEQAEKRDHDDSKPYQYTLPSIKQAVKGDAPQRTEVLRDSVKLIEHLGTDLKHRDEVKLEVQRVGDEFRFHLSALHVASAVPELEGWMLGLAGWLLVIAMAWWRRKPGG